MESGESGSLGLGTKLKRRLAHLPSLAQISEDPEDSELESESPYSFVSPSPMIAHRLELQETEVSLGNKEINYKAAYFLSVLHKLEAYKGVVQYVIEEATARHVLDRSPLNSHKYYDEFIRSSPRSPRANMPKGRAKSLSAHQAYVWTGEQNGKLPAIKLSRSLMGPSANAPIVEMDEREEAGLRTKQRDPVRPHNGPEVPRAASKSLTGDNSRDDSYSSPSSGRSRATSRYGTSSRSSHRGGLKAPPRLLPNAESRLAQNRGGLEEIFRKICGSEANAEVRTLKATPQAFTSYLNTRYPPHMTTLILSFFKFTANKSFADYLHDIEKVLNQREDRVSKLAFDCFDFNQDKYICSRDAFAAIAMRQVDCYDHDLVKIKGMFAMKRNRMVPTKKDRGRVGSRMSSRGGEMLSSGDSSKRKMPHYHPTKPEAIIFTDFQKIEFSGGKPQLILDLFNFICGVSLQDFNPFGFGFAGPADRPPSEELIADSYLSREAEQQFQSDPRINYYNELVSPTQTAAMNVFPTTEECHLLLKKFQLLRCQELVNAVISESSMVQNFPIVFGAKCDYLASRIYYVFSGPKNLEVTKPLFLRTIFRFLRGNDIVQSKFIFSIYASRGEAIFQDDVNNLLEGLPPGSEMQKECMKLVDKFVLAAVGKDQEPLESISYHLFCEIVPESLLVRELSDTFSGPVEGTRTNKAFSTVES